MLFADIRGSTALAERTSPSEFAAVLNRFYEAATRVLVRREALIDRFVGDEVIALFVPGFAGAQHAAHAIGAARSCSRSRDIQIHRDPGSQQAPVYMGTAFVGVVGSDLGVTDITALGDPVNATARLASVASAGEILVGEAACSAAGLEGVGAATTGAESQGKARTACSEGHQSGSLRTHASTAVKSPGASRVWRWAVPAL